MTTADKSPAMIDYASRRRFDRKVDVGAIVAFTLAAPSVVLGLWMLCDWYVGADMQDSTLPLVELALGIVAAPCASVMSLLALVRIYTSLEQVSGKACAWLAAFLSICWCPQLYFALKCVVVNLPNC